MLMCRSSIVERLASIREIEELDIACLLECQHAPLLAIIINVARHQWMIEELHVKWYWQRHYLLDYREDVSNKACRE